MNPLIRPWLPPRVDDLVIVPDDEAIYGDGDAGRTDYYSWYRWAASIVQPDVVLEIGVRLGYSGWALGLPGRAGRFVGFDNESYVAGSNLQALLFLKKRYRSVRLHAVDTQTIGSLRPFLGDLTPQLIHIDGDHSFAGCLHDLQLAHEVLPAGGAVLVDDASLQTAPGQACQAFLQQHPGYAAMTWNEAFSFRGHHLLVRLEPPPCRN